MSDVFNTALHRAKQMSRPKRQNVAIGIQLSMAEGGGLSSIPKRMNIKGEPHQLAYINPDKASLLRQMGGSGKSVNGVPAYFWDVGDDPSGAGWDVGKDTDIGTDKDEGGSEAWENIKAISEKEAALRKEEENKASIWDYFNIFGFSPSTERGIKERQNAILDKMGAAGNFSGRISISGMGRGGNTNPGGSWIGRKEGGGLSSVQKQINIGGEPHQLSYINSDEASLLKQLGGSGRDVNGVPAYYFDDTSGDFGGSWDDPGDMDLGSESAWSDVAANEVEQAAAIASIAAGEFDPGGGISINPLTMQEDAVELAAAQAVDARADAAAIAQQEADTWGWGMYGTPEEEEAITAAALDREAASQSTAESLVSARAKLDDDYFKKAFDKLEGTWGKFAHAKEVTNWTQAQIDAWLEENPGQSLANTMIDLEGVAAPTTYHDFFDPYGIKGDIQRSQGTGKVSSWQDLKALSGAGMQSGGIPGRNQEFESYGEATQYVVDQIRKDRQEEQDELDRMNIQREEEGKPPLSEPVAGWKSPELHESTVFDLANWAIQTGSGISGELLNFIQRQYGSGEFDQEVAGWKDIMDYYNNLGILTGYRGPQFMKTYMGEVGTPDPEFSEDIPRDQPQTPQQKKEEKLVKKLGIMANYLETEDDEDKTKRTLDTLNSFERAIFEKMYPHLVSETANAD